jgi:hypothetical protein
MNSRFAILTFGALLMSGPALAADPRLATAQKTVDAIAGDAGKLKTYCNMIAAMDAADAEKDPAKNDAANKQIEDMMASLGPDMQAVWNLGEELDPATPDGKTLSDAMDGLTGKCSK